MSKKHRRDVIIARIVFVIFLLVMGVLIWKLAAWGIEKFIPEQESTQTETETETETQPYFVIDPNAPTTETEGEPETETQSGTEAGTAERTAKVTTGVRMRKEPNTDCEILTVIGEGTEVTVLGEEGEWSQISFGGFTGYVKTEYLEMVEQNIE